MVKLDVWLDKLPEDKAKYYNKTRMSMEFFAQKIGLAPNEILADFKNNGYIYNQDERTVTLSLTPALTRLRSRMTLPNR